MGGPPPPPSCSPCPFLSPLHPGCQACPVLIIRPLPPRCTDGAQISCSCPASTPSSQLALAMLQASQTQNIQQLNGTTTPSCSILVQATTACPPPRGSDKPEPSPLFPPLPSKTLQQICPLLSLLTVTIQGSGCQNLSPRQLWEPPHWSPGF